MNFDSKMIMIFAIVSLATIVISWYLVKWLIAMLTKQNIVDTPNDRTIHQGAVPRGGGLVIVLMLILVLSIFSLIDNRSSLFLGLLVTVLFWAGLSWWDDQHDLSARFRFLWQLVFAGMGVAAFGWINPVYVSPRIWFELAWFAPLVSFIGVVWMANLYNFMDGLDGLAAGQTIIASITFAVWFGQLGDVSLALTCVVLAAASYGFSLWNWSPAKIFMGDVGSITIGAFFATLIIIITTRYNVPVIASVILFGMFVFDATATLLRRFIRGENISQAHRTHHYQRLATLGIAHEKIAVGSLVFMLLCSLIASLAASSRDMIGAAIFLFVLLIITAVIIVKIFEYQASKITHSN